MLRLPTLEILKPRTAEEAVAMRVHADAYLAGGTDLLVNLKQRVQRAERLVSLGQVQGLDRVERSDQLEIGAMVTLHNLAAADIPTGLRQALRSIAGPQHRRMGTIGGNVLLDTRCVYVNQTEPWRDALGKCLKAEGDWCHVVHSAKACVAAQSSDSVPMLVALGARLRFLTVDGPLECDLHGLFTKDGRYDQLTIPRTALLTHILLPLPTDGQRSVYRKIRARNAVDFPVASVAIAGHFEDGMARQLSIVLGAMLPAPRKLDKLDSACGIPWDDALIEHLAERVHKLSRPMTTVHGDPDWRRRALRVETRRALYDLRLAR